MLKSILAVGGFNANALSVLQESFLAKASDDAVAGADRARMWVGARRWACSSAGQENFVGIAFRHWWKHHKRFCLDFRAFAGFNAFTGIISEHSLFASAAGFADTWAQGVRVLAGAIATFALTEFFVFFAFFDRFGGHQRFRFHLWRAFDGLDAFSVVVFSEITLFASAAGNADTWAHGVGFRASSIASFALTVFFVFTIAHLSRHGRHGFGGWHAASFRMNADAVFVFQESGFAEATDDAVAGADRAGVRVGARGRASGSAGVEYFVFFALRNFWWISEELHSWGIALSGFDAHATSISQKTFFAEATDDALFGADGAGIWVGAGGGARRSAGIEKFIGRAFWFG